MYQSGSWAVSTGVTQHRVTAATRFTIDDVVSDPPSYGVAHRRSQERAPGGEPADRADRIARLVESLLRSVEEAICAHEWGL